MEGYLEAIIRLNIPEQDPLFEGEYKRGRP